MKYDSQNREIVDQTPVEMPLGYRTPEPLQSLIQRLVRVESANAQREGKETFEEADDFETGEDEPMMTSPYEMTQMQEEYVNLEHPSEQPPAGAERQEAARPQQEIPLEKPQKVVEKDHKEASS